MLNNTFIKATNLSDAWFQSLYGCVENGRSFTIDRGSYAGDKRLEFDYFTIQITHPWVEPLLPKVNPMLGFPDPVQDDYLNDYVTYLMTGEKKEGESYTYGSRICKYEIDSEIVSVYGSDKYKNIVIQDEDVWKIAKDNNIVFMDSGKWYLNQMELMIWMYKNNGYRNNQMILQVGKPDDMLLQDPACLRHIDTRIQDGKLHFFPYFRSWDLFGGFPANLAAIELMKQYCASQIGVENGEIIASSKGLHLYSYVWEISEALRGKKILSDYK
jgi:thymidylate synthase